MTTFFIQIFLFLQSLMPFVFCCLNPSITSSFLHSPHILPSNPTICPIIESLGPYILFHPFSGFLPTSESPHTILLLFLLPVWGPLTPLWLHTVSHYIFASISARWFLPPYIQDTFVYFIQVIFLAIAASWYSWNSFVPQILSQLLRLANHNLLSLSVSSRHRQCQLSPLPACFFSCLFPEA